MNRHWSHKSEISNTVSLFAILFIFAVSSLFLISVSVQVYKNVTVNNGESFNLRNSLSYVATKARQSDSQDGIRIDEKNGIPVLTFRENIDGTVYETLVYHYKESLYELFQEEGMTFDPAAGASVIRIHDFTFQQNASGQLALFAENDKGETQELTLSMRTGS